ncbi:uncharacterized protein LOC129716705 [Wyeomyia smithii]|uniref:uncharacterized protein LOC129716705 n=2 Tax=Wyeomyia smithii TaxID=174621 RepID=UPI002468164F|nr:uncharacterized protein LOC129716705 [Wyeomyia smithii]
MNDFSSSHNLKELAVLKVLRTEPGFRDELSETTAYLDTQSTAFHNNLNNRNKSTANKLQNIIQCMNSLSTIQTNEKAITNATNVQVPPETTALLSLGPKFALPVTHLSQVPLFRVLSDLETIIQSHQDKRIQDSNRCRATNIILNYIHGFGSLVDALEPIGRWCTEAQKTTAKFLKAHPEILVLSSDKGNRTVIMYAKEYHEKIRALVDDQATYRNVPRDPTEKIQRKNNNFVTTLLNLKLIDSKTAKWLKTYNAVCPRIYGQPKAHKTNLPLRPVVPNYSAPTYKLCKFVANILNTHLTSTFNTASSFKLCDELKSFILPEDHIMVSLDVVSLFTNVPRKLVTKTITDRWHEINTEIHLELFLEIVEFCMEASYFRYDNKFYYQTYGTAMGSPLSPILADIVLESIIHNALSHLPFEVPILRKYVDDLFLIIPKDSIDTVLDTFNSQEDRIQFTIEIEQDRKLPFLDLLLNRQEDQSLFTEWYSKPISSGRMLNFHSYHQYKHKINVANNFIHRVTSLTSNPEATNVNTIIHKHLQANSYPRTLVSRLINLYHSRQQEVVHPSAITLPPPAPPPTTAPQPTAPPPSSQQPHQASNAPSTANNLQDMVTLASTTSITPSINIAYRSLLYIPKLSDRLIKLFKKDYPHICIATKLNKTVNSFHSQVKDPTNKNENSNIIYKIPCSGCNSSYIGMTSNKLKTRLYGHASNVNKLNQILNADTQTNYQLSELREKTALIEHCIDTEHRFDLENTCIIDRSKHTASLPFLEMCHIYCTPHIVNRRIDVDNLNTAYAGILHKLKSLNEDGITVN